MKIKFYSLYLNVFLIVLVLFSTFFFLDKSNFTAFEQNTLSFIPGLEFYNSKDNLDFFTKSIFVSPKKVIVSIIYYLGTDWYQTTYFLKIFLVIIKIPLIFLFCISIVNYWLFKSNIKVNINILFLVFFGYLILLSDFYQPLQSNSNNGSPLGYGSIHYEDDFHAMLLSFVLGSIGMIISFNKKKFFSLKTIIFFSLSTLFHPVMGICNFILFSLFYFEKIKNFFEKEYIIFFILTIVVPIFLLLLITDNQSNITSKEFFDIYVTQRQPHHYIVSNKVFLISKSSFITWVCLFAINSIIAYLFINKKIFNLFIKIFLFILCVPIIQFIFVEVLFLQSFVKLGITRFTTFFTLILFLQHSFIAIFFFKHLIFNKSKGRKKFNLDLYVITVVLVTLVCSIFVYNKTFVSPLKDQNFKKYIHMTDWIKKNLKNQNSVFFTEDINLLPSFLRIYGKKSIYHDENMPFTLSLLKEYSIRTKNRNIIEESFASGNTDGILMFKNDIHYLIFDNKFAIARRDYNVNLKIIFSNDYYIVYKNELSME